MGPTVSAVGHFGATMERPSKKKMSTQERIEYAKDRARHYIHCTPFHKEGESYYSSHGWWLVFGYFMGVPVKKLPAYDQPYLKQILENNGNG